MTMTMSCVGLVVSLLALLSFLSSLSPVDGSPLSRERGSVSNSLGLDDLRLYELHETTTWSFIEDCYNTHNALRMRHNSRELKLNRTLVDYARLKSLILAWYDGDVGQEKDGNMFGENISWNQTATEPVNCSNVVANWYAPEDKSWDYEAPHLDDTNRHFAQIVWNNSRRFGCGQALSRGPKGGVYTVCYYDPTVVAGAEKENVNKPIDTEAATTTPATPATEATASSAASPTSGAAV